MAQPPERRDDRGTAVSPSRPVPSQTGAAGPGGAGAGAPLTIRELVEIPHLGTRLIAGASGDHRLVTWAHASEVAAPWEWLEPGDLLMALGLGIPTEPSEQSRFVEQLAASGVSGIVLAEEFAPPLSAAFLQAADHCALPVLMTTWTVPFGQISRTVAAASYGSQLGNLVRVSRLYDLVRKAVAEHKQPLELFRQLAAEARCDLYVCNNDGSSAFGADGAPPDAFRDAFVEAVEQHAGRLPGFLRLTVDSDTLLTVPIPTSRPTSLLAAPHGDPPPFAIMQHIATVAALELERTWLGRAELRRLGGETLAVLLRGRMIQGTAAALRRLGLAGRSLVVLVATHDDPAVFRDLHNVLADHGIENMLIQAGEILMAVIPGEARIVEQFCELLPEHARAGISDAFTDPTQTPTANEEARWALGATTASQRIARAGEHTVLFGARSRAEASALVRHVLGPVLEYDAANGSNLLTSLQVFLRCNRSWKDAAAQLFVHKQTLIYRIRRIEELTGRRLNETSDVADLWIALRAYDVVGA